MLKILIDGWFSLPRLGKDTYLQLMKLGVEYDKEMGFRINQQTNIESAVRLISSTIGEEVELAVRCFLCGREACVGCTYLKVCDRRRVSPVCLCDEHFLSSDIYSGYKKIFLENLKV